MDIPSNKPPNDSERLRLALIALSILANEAIATARRHHLDKAAIESIHREFDRLKDIVRKQLFDWDKATSTTVEEFCSPALENTVVRIRGQISVIENPIMIEAAGEDEPDVMSLLANRPDDHRAGVIRTLRSTMTIMSDMGKAEEMLPITDRHLIEAICRQRLTMANFEVMAVVITVPVISVEVSRAVIAKQFKLLPLDIRPLMTALQIVAPTPGELQEADHLAATVDRPLLYMMDRIEKYLGIQGLDRLPILKEAIEMQVIAAATEGQRASTTVIGPPGIGKSLVSKASAIVQPILREAMPTKVTEAGLIGTGSSSAGHDSRRAGLLPLADQGAFVVQDWHQSNQVKNQRLTSALATMMQDGVVHDSSASRCSYRAQVSVIIDANRLSDVRRTRTRDDEDGLARFIADTKIPLNILTRVTYVAEIPRSVEDQILTLAGILASTSTDLQTVQKALKHDMRLIKVWLARARDVHRNVIIPDAVARHLSMSVQKAINVCSKRLELRGDYGDFMVRLAEQATMLTKAHARLHNRSVATAADVDGVFPYLHRKMAFVRTLLYGDDTEESDVRAAAPGRQMLMRLRLKAGHYTAKQARHILCLQSCSEDAVATDMAYLYGEADDEGRYHVHG